VSRPDLACASGLCGCARLLLEAGADTQRTSYGKTALQVAEQAVEPPLSLGADSASGSGVCAASPRGQKECAALLREWAAARAGEAEAAAAEAPAVAALGSGVASMGLEDENTVNSSATNPAAHHHSSARGEEAEALLLCSICMDAPKTRACVPCGHVCVCEACAAPLKRCPICRVTCTDIMRIYLS
jgi:hypothetical protein